MRVVTVLIGLSVIPQRDHDVSRDYRLHSRIKKIDSEALSQPLNGGSTGDSRNDLKQVAWPFPALFLASSVGVVTPASWHHWGNDETQAGQAELLPTELRGLLPHTCHESLTFCVCVCSKITKDATSWNFWIAQTVKTTHIKTEIAETLVCNYKTRCGINVTHPHTVFLPQRKVFKWAPNLENLGMKPLAFDRDWWAPKISGSQLRNRPGSVISA